MKIYFVIIYVTFICIGFWGCKKEGPEGKKALLDMIVEPQGENCSSGGFKIISGIDLNNNNILDLSEIQSTKYICNGNNGNNSLLNILPEPQGDNCSSGGYKVVSGIDLNNNNLLDNNEIQNTKYVCNGDNGANGTNGTNGNNSLLNILPEPQGDNCSSGGYKVVTGIDLNNNNSLDNNEIQNTEFVCNGNNGANGINALLNIFPVSIEVFNGKSPTNWTELDLSSAVGKNYSLVILKLNNLSTTNGLLALFRRKGDTSDYIMGSSTSNSVSVGFNGVGQAITFTDSLGKIEWKSNNYNQAKIEVIAYVK